MNRVFQILNAIHSKEIGYCLQSRGDFHNLSVEDLKGKPHYLSSLDFKDIEAQLELIWGHLVPKKKTLPPIPEILTMATAMPMPIPGV